MAIPGQSLSIPDPGLGPTPEAVNAFLLMGACEKGAVNTLYAFNRKGDAVDTLGQGPLTELGCKILDLAGGPVYFMRLTGSVAGAAGAVTPTLYGTATGTITVAGAAFDAYNVRIEIATSGTVGVARFRYSLDASSLLKSDQYSWSEVLTVPAGGTFVIPNTNLTLTFVPGAGAVFFERGDVHTFTTTAPYYSTANLASGVTALLADSHEFASLVLTGEPVSTSAGVTMFGAFTTHLSSLQAQFRYLAGMMDAGTDTPTNAITDYAAVASSRILPAYGDVAIDSSKPFAGWGTPRMPALVSVAARAAQSLISTDLARVASGPLEGVVAISHDEFRTELLDSQKLCTLRTWQGSPGFYITNGRLKSAPGSDFQFWQHRRLMDVACSVVIKMQQQYINASVRTRAGTGAMDERDAVKIEQKVLSALSDVLLSPSNAEGTPGHVSRLDYKIDRTNNINTTGVVLSTVAFQPLGYVKSFSTQISFAILKE